MAEILLIDTDVLIDYLRGHPNAVTYLEDMANPFLIHAVSVAELYGGVQEGDERYKLDKFLSSFEIVLVDKEMAVKGGLYRRDFGKSHNVGLADALIAAGADFKGATLVTLNRKHFPMLSKSIVPYVKSAKKKDRT